MRKIYWVMSICIVTLLILTGCSKSASHSTLSEDGRKKVLCTIHMISDLTQKIAGETVQIHTLIKKDLDPHAYELVKGDDEQLTSADLIFYNGLGLEHHPNIFQHLTTHSNSHAVGHYLQEHYPQALLITDHVLDPHIWMDIALWEKIIPCLVEELSKIEPQHQELYRANGEALQLTMQKLHQNITSLLQKIPADKRYLITCHDAFYYFAKSYLAAPGEHTHEDWRKRFIAPEGLAPDCQLSTTDIQRVVQFIQKNDVKTIFPEYNVNLDSIHKIQDATQKFGLNVRISESGLYGDSLSQEKDSASNYFEMQWHNALTIYQQLSEEL